MSKSDSDFSINLAVAHRAFGQWLGNTSDAQSLPLMRDELPAAMATAFGQHQEDMARELAWERIRVSMAIERAREAAEECERLMRRVAELEAKEGAQ